MTHELQVRLDALYQKAIDYKTSDNYASALRRKARQLLLASGEPSENWPAWAEDGAPWQQAADRLEPVDYPPDLPEGVQEALEGARLNNTPAAARALCREVGIPPPPWAVR